MYLFVIVGPHCKKMIFIFGAGASYADGFPLQSELLHLYFQLYKDNDLEIDAYNLLLTFFSDFFNIRNPLSENLPTLEHVLGTIELCLRDKAPYSPDYDHIKLRKLRSALLDAILCTIRQKSSGFRKGTYHKFLNNLDLKYKNLANCHFITLNYDHALDDAFDSLYNRVLIDFGVELTNYEVTSDPFYWWERPDPGKGTFLLKLHGSLTFKYCPLCQSIELIPWEFYFERKGMHDLAEIPLRAAIKRGSAKCPRDGALSELLVIPPTLFKELRIPPLVEIWRRANALLLAHKELIIIGYSIPLADLHMWQLLKRAELTTGPKKVIIIDAPSAINIEVEQRYKQIFKDIIFLPVGFEAFAANPNEYLKYV